MRPCSKAILMRMRLFMSVCVCVCVCCKYCTSTKSYSKSENSGTVTQDCLLSTPVEFWDVTVWKSLSLEVLGDWGSVRQFGCIVLGRGALSVDTPHTTVGTEAEW